MSPSAILLVAGLLACQPRGADSAAAPVGADPTNGTPTATVDADPHDSGGQDSAARDSGVLTPVLPLQLRIEPGAITHGCTWGWAGSCDPDEAPFRVIRLTRPFTLSQTEVTQPQFESLMGYNPSTFLEVEHPVENVTWHEAAAYTNRLSELLGLASCYDCQGQAPDVVCTERDRASFYDCPGFRLPTEAEWEHAARCGEDWKFAGSTEIEEVAFFADNSRNSTRPVGRKAPNTCGLFDLSGNVWEWTNDWYQDTAYESRPDTDPMGPDTAYYRVMRGGSWNTALNYCRVAERNAISPSFRYYPLGFRVAQTLFEDTSTE